MHLELTQILICPHCGPPNGLIAFVDRLEERRIVEGRLDCPVCERRHSVREGRVLLGDGAEGADSGAEGAGVGVRGAEAASDDPAATAAALLGPPKGPEILLLAGGAESSAPAIADLRPEATVVTLGPGSTARHPRVYPVIPSHGGEHLPFRPGTFGGAVLTGGRPDLVAEVVPALAAGARLVVLVPHGLRPDQAALSLRELASDARAWVGVRA